MTEPETRCKPSEVALPEAPRRPPPVPTLRAKQTRPAAPARPPPEPRGGGGHHGGDGDRGGSGRGPRPLFARCGLYPSNLISARSAPFAASTTMRSVIICDGDDRAATGGRGGAQPF
jgi:hypothetical protein